MALACLFLPSEALSRQPGEGNGTFQLAKTIRDKKKMSIDKGTETEDLIWVLENHEYRATRRRAAEFLGDRGATEAIPNLLNALKDPEYVVQKAAAEALTKVGDEKLFEPLMENLSSPRSHVREYSAYVLGHLAKGKDHREILDVIEALEGLAKDESNLVRDQVFNALLEIGAPACKGIFVEGMKDEDPDVRRHSANALAKIKGSEAEDALVSAYKVELNQETKQAISTALGGFGTEKALQTLVATMYKQSASERAKITAQLAASGSQESVDILSDLIVSDTSPLVRTRAAEGLLQAMNPSSVQKLAEALTDKVQSVKIPASKALVKLADDSVTEELVNAMGDTNDTVGENAARALVRIRNPEIIPDLMLLLDHADASVVDRATAVLEELTYKPYGTDIKRWKMWYEENYDEDSLREDLEAKDAT
jgi:HEAT repeat protein